MLCPVGESGIVASPRTSNTEKVEKTNTNVMIKKCNDINFFIFKYNSYLQVLVTTAITNYGQPYYIKEKAV
jgi:hypothetical protein